MFQPKSTTEKNTKFKQEFQMDSQHNRMSKWNWRPNEGAKINRTKQRIHMRRMRRSKKKKKLKRAQPSCTLRKGKKKYTIERTGAMDVRYKDA